MVACKANSGEGEYMRMIRRGGEDGSVASNEETLKNDASPLQETLGCLSSSGLDPIVAGMFDAFAAPLPREP